MPKNSTTDPEFPETASKIIKLFREYDDKTAKVDETKAALLRLEDERSDLVASILEASSGERKFRRRGAVWTIVQRGARYFFRGTGGVGTPNVVSVD